MTTNLLAILFSYNLEIISARFNCVVVFLHGSELSNDLAFLKNFAAFYKIVSTCSATFIMYVLIFNNLKYRFPTYREEKPVPLCGDSYWR